MNDFVKALAPVFAVGFAPQQLLEILDPIVAKLTKTPNTKKLVLGLVSLVIGLTLAWKGGFQVLKPLTQSNAHPDLDLLVTGLVISAGTEGVNSIMKFLGYKKEEQKSEAAKSKDSAKNVLSLVNRQ